MGHNKGEISSPGRYLGAIVAKALAGELHLERSVYGRIFGGAGMNADRSGDKGGSIIVFFIRPMSNP